MSSNEVTLTFNSAQCVQYRLHVSWPDCFNFLSDKLLKKPRGPSGVEKVRCTLGTITAENFKGNLKKCLF